MKTRVTAIKMTPDQDKLIAERAARCKVSKSAWIRSIAVQAATQPYTDGYIRKIREPDGALY